jgi:hypothetical protein
MLEEDATVESVDNEQDIDSILADKWQEISSRNEDEPFIEPEPTEQVAEQVEPEQPPEPTIKPPSSWKKDLQEKFSTLAPEFQTEILRREDDFHKGIQSYKAAAEWTRQFEPIADTFAGLRETYGSEAKGIQTLYDAGQFANNDPVGFITAFAKSRGISLDGNHVQAESNPIINQLKQQVEQLSGYVGTQQQQEQQRAHKEAENAIKAFSSKPEAKHFDVLKADMAALLQSGLAETLEDAYDRALWQRKELRELEVSRQITERQKQAKKAAIEAKEAASVNVKQRGHKPAAAAEIPMEEFMRQQVEKLGLG